MAYKFLLAFDSNEPTCSLYQVDDRDFSYSPAFAAAVKGSRQNVAITFATEKREWRDQQILRKFHNTYTLFDTRSDGRTDRQTDTARRRRLRYV